MNNFHHGFLPEHIYHVYNRTNNGETLFLNDSQRQLFLNKLKAYTDDCTSILAYCLMDTHFHLLIKTKREDFIKTSLRKQKAAFLTKNDLYFLSSKPYEYYHSFISKRFSNFFNSYTKCFNLMNDRKGNLFNRGFKRIIVDKEDYFFQLIKYIHFNPVKEQLVQNVTEYNWSSYNDILCKNGEYVSIHEVLKMVDMNRFLCLHKTT